MLNILSDKKRHYFYEQHLGEERKVLFEKHKKENWLTGFTDNYIKIEMPHTPERINSIQKVRLKHINTEGNVDAELIFEKV